MLICVKLWFKLKLPLFDPVVLAVTLIIMESHTKTLLPRCEECWDIFANLEAWRHHRQLVHGINIGCFKCHKCNFKTSDKQLLNQHLLTKHKIVLPRCVECNMYFETTGHWQMHRSQVHLSMKSFYFITLIVSNIISIMVFYWTYFVIGFNLIKVSFGKSKLIVA